MSGTPVERGAAPASQRQAMRVSHVMFDFDGTLSWLRHGWPEMMLELFFHYFPAGAAESAGQIREMLMSEILALNGKPTIHQMVRFCDLVAIRGGSCPAPKELLQQYQARLDAAIEERSARIFSGKSDPDDFVIFGARKLLQLLKRRGLTLIILSGTVEHRVRQEAGWLELAEFFGDHIYGSTPDHTRFSKREVIERILREERIEGGHLLSFGDGPVEIAETRAVGGVSIGVASDESINGSGLADPVKQRILKQAGANGLIADYRNPEVLIQRFF